MMIEDHIINSIKTKSDLLNNESLISSIYLACDVALGAYKSGGKILLAGNGGSAADSQHIAAELVGRFRFDRPALPAIALTTDTSILTAVGNDYGYDSIFSRQLNGLASNNDVLIVISTSGNSKNIINAINELSNENLSKKKIKTIGLLGSSGGQIKQMVDVPICVPSDKTEHIQEAHIMISHILCRYIEDSLFSLE